MDSDCSGFGSTNCGEDAGGKNKGKRSTSEVSDLREMRREKDNNNQTYFICKGTDR